MPATKETINTELFNTLKSRGYEPAARSAGDQKASISDADLFVFKFTKGNQSYGPARVAIDEKNNLVLYTNERLEDSPQSKTKGNHFDDSWNGLKNYLRKWSRMHGLNGFKLVTDGYLQSDMAMRKDMKNKKLNEGYYALGKKASYNDSIPTVKILLQHTRQIEEGEQRYRNIEKIFVENINGERFLLPTRRPGIAKVYARHIAEGGTPYDERGKHITCLIEEYTKMAGFVRATRNGQFSESAQRLVTEGISHYQNLRETLSSMISVRGYNKYFDSYSPILNEESDDNVSLNELFVEETIDPRIESVMPILKRLSKNLNEMSEVKALEEWATNITEQNLVEGWQSYYRDWLDSDFAPDRDDDQEELIEKAKMYIDDATLFKKSDDWIENMALNFTNKYLDDSFYMNEMDQTTKTLAVPASDMLDEVSIATLKSAEYNASSRAEKFKKEIERLKASGDTSNLQKYEKAYKYYKDLADKTKSHPAKMQRISTAKELGSILPAKMKNVAEAPGAETLAHNQDTEEKNLKAFGLAEGFTDTEEVADEVMKSMGGLGKLTRDDIRDAVIEFQQDMDDPYKLDVEEVVENIINKLEQKGIKIADTSESVEEQIMPKVYFVIQKGNSKVVGTWNGEVFKPFDKSKFSSGVMDMIPQGYEVDKVSGPVQKDEIDKVKAVTEGEAMYHHIVVDGVSKAKYKDMAKAKELLKAMKDRFPDKKIDIESKKEFAEDLDANQKRVGQLGPTEKVGPQGAVGKLVGASESVENVELNRIKEMIGYK